MLARLGNWKGIFTPEPRYWEYVTNRSVKPFYRANCEEQFDGLTMVVRIIFKEVDSEMSEQRKRISYWGFAARTRTGETFQDNLLGPL